MGGKTATTTQSVKIPEEVMARYNAVNARAEKAAEKPFQRYTGEFVAPLTQTQQSGISATNAAAGAAQPYYQDATQQLLNAQRTSAPIYNQAYSDVSTARDQGQYTTQGALQALSGGQAAAAPMMGESAALTGRGLTAAEPYMDSAGNYLRGGARGVDAGELGQEQIERYMSPYTKNVIQAQQALQAQEAAQQRAALQSQQVGSGSFGGERSGLSQANLARQQSMANQATLSNLLQSGYGQALGVAQQQQAQKLAADQANRAAQQFGTQAAAGLGQQAFGQNLAAAQQYGNLGQSLFGQGAQQAQIAGALGQQQYGMGLGAAQTQAGFGKDLYGMGAQTAQSLAGLGAGAQQAALQGAQAQIGAGTLEQQTKQAEATANYQQFLQERGYDFQMAQFLANIAMGTGALSGSTTTTTQPAGFFSDERLKNNIEPIGELFDGQTVYRYDMGDGRTQIGLIAQEVEGSNPEAVGESQGYKTVDYGRATDEAADLGAAASMGGAVMEPGAYAGGGLVDRDYLKEILASQNQSFGSFGGPAYGGASQGLPFGKAGSVIPEAKLPVAKLVTAGNAPAQRASGLSEAANTGKTLAEFGRMGKTALLGSAPTKGDPKGGAGILGSGGSMSSEDNLFTRGKEFLGFEYGGVVPRQGYALQGSVNPYETEDDPIQKVIDSQEEQKAPELMKPGQAPGAPKSGLSDVKDIASIGTTLASLAAFLPFSDARLKDNIEPVGKTFDGQNIYRYDMGDGRTQLGLMAQEVREHKPDAVGERNGFLTLDYDRATEDAAPFAYGGLVPRSGYAEGGVPGEEDLPAVGAQEAAMPVADVKPQENPLASLITRTAEKIGVQPVDLGTAISYETAGTFDPWKRGPTTKWGEHRGWIQWGEPQRKQYGVTQDSTPEQQMDAVGRYLVDRGVKPGMGLKDIYSAINAGSVGRYNASDEQAGGAPGTVADKVAGMGDHRAKAARLLGLDPGDTKGQAPPRPPGLVPQGGVEARPAAAKPTYGGASAREAGVGDVAREFLPEGTVTSERFWVPALSFIGSALASRNPTLGGALGEGIVGGVAGYQSQQRQQADLAKTALDIIKDRFVIRTNPETGETQYFNKSGGQKLTPSQFSEVTLGITKSLGIPPASLGIEIPKGMQAPKAIGAIGAEAALPKPAAEAAEGAKPAVTGDPAKAGEPAPIVNKYAMSLGDLKTYAEQNPKEFALTGERDPSKQRAEIKKYEAAMLNAQEQGNEAEAGRYFNLAKQSREILDQNINDAVELQYKTNQEIKKAGTQRTDDYLKNVGKRTDQYETARSSLSRLADIYGRYEPGRPASIKAELQSWFNAAGIPLPESFSAAKYDEAMKIALTQAFGLVGANELSRAPKAALESTIQTTPAPSLAAGAAYALIGKTLGEMDYYHNRDKAYIKQGRGIPPEEFLMDYEERNKGKLNESIGKAYAKIPVGRGVKREDIDSLKDSYKFTPRLAGEPSTEQSAVPEASAIPAPDQREPNRVYDIPGKGQYRWMGTGWQKVTQ